MAESVQTGLMLATQVAHEATPQHAPNGLKYGAYPSSEETTITPADLARMVQAVPAAIAAALTRKTYYFVPLALSDPKADTKPDAKPELTPDPPASESEDNGAGTMIATTYTAELVEQAICHRNVTLGDSVGTEKHEGVFISTRLLSDRFALAFEFFINIGHAFVDTASVPAPFAELVWTQALADVRGETSQDAWESRAAAHPSVTADPKPPVNEKAKTDYMESAFSDAVAIYLLSLSVDFDYAELREREYPLLAARALADRLRLVAKLFPPNSGYEFAIRYRRRA
jgi:hypothetical protein